MSKVISQREARRMKWELDRLERRDAQRQSAWTAEYPGGVNIDTIDVQGVEYVAVKTAWLLGHPVIVKPGKTNELIVYAIRKS